jgi:hypothetical protein
MINPDLQPGKPVQTRSGLEAVIYAVHEGQDYPIIGAYKDKDGNWAGLTWCADGAFFKSRRANPLDIIPSPKRMSGFVNVYDDGFVTLWEDRHSADWSSSHNYRNRIACIDLAELNLTEGHGLTEVSSDASTV